MTQTDEQHKKTYAKIATPYSIMDAINYLIEECYRLNDFKKVMILQKALSDMQDVEPVTRYNRQDLDNMITMFRKILNMDMSQRDELLELISLIEDQSLKSLTC